MSALRSYQLLMVLLLIGKYGAAADTVQLTELEFFTQDGSDVITLQLNFDQAAPKPKYFLPYNQNRLVIDLPDTREQIGPLPTTYPSGINSLSIAENSTTTRLVISAETPLFVNYAREQQHLTFTLATVFGDKHQTPPENINLILNQEPLTKVLQQICKLAGKNLMLNGEITGTASVNLNQVNWRDAFNMLAKQHHLTVTEEGGILLVNPPPTAPSGTDSTAEDTTHSADSHLSRPLTTEIIPLHYADAVDLKKTLESSSQNPLLSDRGVLTVDRRTNSILIKDERSHIDQVRSIIQQLDTPSGQVLIESRIVIASDDFSNELGAKLGITHLDSANQQWGFSLSGNSDAANTALGGTTPDLSGTDNRLSVNLPVANAMGSIGLTLAKLSTGSLIDLELSAAQLEGKTEIIANPRLITSNGYEASIQQGVEIPYRSDTLSGGTDVSFKEAVMELKVTPQITPNRQIILTLQVKKDAAAAILCSGCEPSIDTREIKTRVMIADGETLVIGGIYEESKSDTENRVPLFSDLPLIGSLFKSESTTSGKDELLIFITPSILQQPAT